MDFLRGGELAPALELLQDYPFQPNAALIGVIEALDFGADEARQLVVFLPLAFLRRLLTPRGATFPSECVFVNADGASWSVDLEQEPLFLRCRELAERTISQGMRADALQAIIRRSPEFAAVNELLAAGIEPGELDLDPPVAAWDGQEEAPPAPESAEEGERPWWKFW